VHVCRGAYEFGRQARCRTQGFFVALREILVETVCGALLGTAIGAVACYQNAEPALAMSLGPSIGAALGMVVGVSRLSRVKHSFVDMPPES
jgi:hypothetical protein